MCRMTQQVAGTIPEWTIGDRMRKARELTGLDQAHFAEELGVSRAAVSAIEVGRNRPRRITLRAWALATGVPFTWLETGQAPAGPGPDGMCAARDSNPEPAD